MHLSIGSAVSISSGTYFIRGNFVDVSTDKIVLDPYDQIHHHIELVLILMSS